MTLSNFNADVDGGDIVLTWDEPTHVPKGYNAYRSVGGGAWEKINTELITGLTHTYTPAGAGVYNHFVKAVYSIRNFDQENGNSITSSETIA